MKINEVFSSNEIKDVTKTSRSSGAIGPRAKVPKYVKYFASENDSILDYGAGKDAIHARNLKQEGYDVTAYDIGGNFNPEYHSEKALNKNYDIVYASNVLNVQTNMSMLEKTIKEIKNAIRTNGIAIINYPKEPRKLNLTNKEFKEILNDHFTSIEIVEKGSGPVFKVQK